MDDILKSVECMRMKALETEDAFIFHTIQPYCERIMEKRISKNFLETALLKQQPMIPNFMQDETGIYATCGRCGNKVMPIFDSVFQSYCANCGQKQKWSSEP